MFPEPAFNAIDLDSSFVDKGKIYKIKYTINMLPRIAQHVILDPKEGEDKVANRGISLSALLADTKELNIFKSGNVRNFIDFRWSAIGKLNHTIGFCFHALYLIFLAYYIDDVYINNHPKFPSPDDEGAEVPPNEDGFWLIIAILYPILYEFLEMFSCGFVHYFTSAMNLNNQLFIWLSILNAIIQMNSNPLFFSSRLVMLMTILFSVIRTFEFMRIFILFSPVV